MSQDKEAPVVLPRLDNNFFSVCSSAIAAATWPRKEFDKVRNAEGLLAALASFYQNLYQQEAESKAAAKTTAEPILPKTAEIPAPTMPQDVPQGIPAPVNPAVIAAIEKDIATPIIKEPATAADPFAGEPQEKKNS